MRILISAILCLLLVGCFAKPMSLAEKEAKPWKGVPDIETYDKTYLFPQYFMGLEKGASKVDKRENAKINGTMNTAIITTLGVSSSLSNFDALGLGLLSDFGRWGSQESVLAQRSMNIANKLVDPAVGFHFESVDQGYGGLMESVQEKVIKFFGKNLECGIFGYSKGNEYAFSRAFHLEGRLKHRLIQCREKGKSMSDGVNTNILLSSRESGEGKSVIQGLIYKSSRDKREIDYTNSMINEVKDLIEPEWSVYFNGIDEKDNYSWKTYYRKGGIVYEIPAPVFLKSEEVRLKQVLKNRQALVKKQVMN